MALDSTWEVRTNTSLIETFLSCLIFCRDVLALDGRQRQIAHTRPRGGPPCTAVLPSSRCPYSTTSYPLDASISYSTIFMSQKLQGLLLSPSKKMCGTNANGTEVTQSSAYGDSLSRIHCWRAQSAKYDPPWKMIHPSFWVIFRCCVHSILLQQTYVGFATKPDDRCCNVYLDVRHKFVSP